MLDVSVIMLERVLEHLELSDKCAILEFKRLQNLRLLPMHPREGRTPETVELSEDPAYYWCDPNFASGRVFLSRRPFASILASTYSTPGIVELMQVLLVPNDTEEAGCIVPWHIRLPHALRKRNVVLYGELFESFVQEEHHPCLPLGLFREFAPEDSDEGYVWTNPSADTEVLASDFIYVLGNASFGKWAAEQGLLTGPCGCKDLSPPIDSRSPPAS
eukprot:gnl/TRDRNA2_/TRDRNA2_63585_c0_seq1.p1 gnl/TRDRNA2_/TRDRNA2_63585_c0~~gnl/TRDRNA2_/TRDRNA2_63585_c0_seq1.p1  ORF type:complete len:248 (+),score=41.27 gnl/TRDRNA2_/TRDRNA2_63585_c0_seq1:95-745(+)